MAVEEALGWLPRGLPIADPVDQVLDPPTLVHPLLEDVLHRPFLLTFNSKGLEHIIVRFSAMPVVLTCVRVCQTARNSSHEGKSGLNEVTVALSHVQ